MADMYAWSNIVVGVDDNGQQQLVACGDKVSEKDLGDSWDQHVESGAIRPYPYPDIEDPTKSPVEYLREQQAALANEEEVMLMALAASHLSSGAAGGADEAVEQARTEADVEAATKAAAAEEKKASK